MPDEEPRWLTLQMVHGLQAQAVALFGGRAGLRDRTLLESAVERPRNLFAHGQNPSIFDSAAAYCAGIIRNHPFIDGNKRTGLLAARAFLFRNGYLLEPEEHDEAAMIIALAAGNLDEAALARWLSGNAGRKPK